MNPFQKLRLMVARGIVNLVNDAGGLQTLQVTALEDEHRDEVERVQNLAPAATRRRAACRCWWRWAAAATIWWRLL